MGPVSHLNGTCSLYRNSFSRACLLLFQALHAGLLPFKINLWKVRGHYDQPASPLTRNKCRTRSSCVLHSGDDDTVVTLPAVPLECATSARLLSCGECVRLEIFAKEDEGFQPKTCVQHLPADSSLGYLSSAEPSSCVNLNR